MAYFPHFKKENTLKTFHGIFLSFYRIIVVQSETASEDEDESEGGGTLRPGSDLTSIQDGQESQGVNLYILAGHENMAL